MQPMAQIISVCFNEVQINIASIPNAMSPAEFDEDSDPNFVGPARSIMVVLTKKDLQSDIEGIQQLLAEAKIALLTARFFRFRFHE
jgi:hypothetical protein